MYKALHVWGLDVQTMKDANDSAVIEDEYSIVRDVVQVEREASGLLQKASDLALASHGGRVDLRAPRKIALTLRWRYDAMDGRLLGV